MKKIFQLFFLLLLLFLSNISTAQNRNYMESREEKLKNIPSSAREWLPWIERNKSSCKDVTDVIHSDSKMCIYAPYVNLSANKNDIVLQIRGYSEKNEYWLKLPFQNNKKLNYQDLVLLSEGQKQPNKIVEKNKINYIELSQGDFELTIRYLKDDFNQEDVMLFQEPVYFIFDDKHDSPSKYTLSGASIGKKSKEEINKINQQKEELNIDIFRKLEDTHTLWLTTHIKIEYVGEEKEIELGKILPFDFELNHIQSDLNVSYRQGSYYASLKNGIHYVEFYAYSNQEISQINIKDLLSDKIKKDEVWSIQTHKNVRNINVSGGVMIDNKKIDMIDDWRKFPTWVFNDRVNIITESKGLSTQEFVKMRGNRTSWYGFQDKTWINLDQMRMDEEKNNKNLLTFKMKRDSKIESINIENDYQFLFNIKNNMKQYEADTHILKQGDKKNLDIVSSQIFDGYLKNILSSDVNVYMIDKIDLFLAPRHRIYWIKDVEVQNNWMNYWNLYTAFALLFLCLAIKKGINVKIAILSISSFILLYQQINFLWMFWIILLFNHLIEVYLPIKYEKMKKINQEIIWINIFSLFYMLGIFIFNEIKMMIHTSIDVHHIQYDISDIICIYFIYFIAKVIWELKGKILKEKIKTIGWLVLSGVVFFFIVIGFNSGSKGEKVPPEMISAVSLPMNMGAESFEKSKMAEILASPGIASNKSMNLPVYPPVRIKEDVTKNQSQVGVGIPFWGDRKSIIINKVKESSKIWIASPWLVNLFTCIQMIFAILMFFVLSLDAYQKKRDGIKNAQNQGEKNVT